VRPFTVRPRRARLLAAYFDVLLLESLGAEGVCEVDDPGWPADVFGFMLSGALRSHPAAKAAHSTATGMISIFMATLQVSGTLN
jgi:hypothetical protein